MTLTTLILATAGAVGSAAVHICCKPESFHARGTEVCLSHGSVPALGISHAARRTKQIAVTFHNISLSLVGYG